jgi:hypothetical protein
MDLVRVDVAAAYGDQVADCRADGGCRGRSWHEGLMAAHHDMTKAIEDLEFLTERELWLAAQNRLSAEARSQLAWRSWAPESFPGTRKLWSASARTLARYFGTCGTMGPVRVAPIGVG